MLVNEKSVCLLFGSTSSMFGLDISG